MIPHFWVSEPRISGIKADNRIKKLGFPHSVKTDAQGFSGGIWVMWNDSLGSISVLGLHPQIITLLVERQGEPAWIISAVYGSPNPTTRVELWEYIKQCSFFNNTPWILIGDFNQILSGEEQYKQEFRGFCNANRMIQCMETRGLMDLGASGPKFTWCNRQFGGELNMKRLDRAIANSGWNLQFSEASVCNLPRTHEDHNPVQVKLRGAASSSRTNMPFCFEAAWLSHPEFKGLLQSSWIPDRGIKENLMVFT